MPVKKATKKTARKTTPGRKGAASAAKPATRSRPRKQVVAATSEPWQIAVRAAEDKKGSDIRVLDLRPVTSFADYFVICSGSNPRQIQAIADEVEQKLKDAGERPKSIEGYSNAEWILMDYGDYVVNVFSERAREYYDLERLWRDAPEVKVAAG